MLTVKLPRALYAAGLFLTISLPIFAANGSHAMAKAMVSAHNLYRSRVGTPPLAWSEKLAARAEAWAIKLIDTGMYAPHRDGLFGENLFEIVGGHENPYQVVSAWASEAANYNHKTNSCTARCGHYTQVVWRSTKFVGCGVARNAAREVWVCDYAPHGNIVGEWPY